MVLDSRASTGLASCEWTAPHDGDATVTHDAASATGRGRAMHVASPEGAGLVWALRRVAKGMPPDSGATPDDGGIGEDPVASMLEVGNMGGLGLARPPAGVSESEAAHHSASLEHSAMMGPVSLLQVSGDSHGAVEAGGDPPVDAHHYLSGHVAWDAAHPSHAGHTDRGGVARAAQHVVDQAGDSMRHLHPVEAAHVARHVHTSLGGLADTAGLTEHHSSRAHAVGTDHVESLARGLVSANVTADAAGGHPAPVGTEAVCPTAATPFPTYFPGRTAWLRHELNGAGAFVLGSLQHVAGPATGAAKIQVYGREGGLDYDRIWIADALKPWRFQVGEVVLLRGFREPGNTGLFEVVARPYRNTLQLGEMLPTTVREGRTAWLTPEVSGGAGGGGGALYGCYGEVVGPAAPSRPMAVHRRGVVCADVALHPERLEAGELVRMRGFAQAGNAGTFRLANSSLVHAPSSRERGSMLCLQLEDARPCEGGRIPWLRREENGRGAVVAGSRGRETLPSHRGAVVRVSGLESGLERGGAGREARAGFTELARWPLTEEGLPARNATRYDGPDALWVDPALGGASLFAEDEVVLLHGFEAPGNMGRFRVARLVGNTTLVLREVDPRDEVCPQVHRPSIEDLIPPITDVTHAIDTAEHERLRVRHLPRSPPHPRPPPPPRPCPKNCSYDQGVCVDGECRCEPTWRGVACDTPQIPCPFNCSGQGTCDETTGRCVCDATWGGAACDHRALPCPMDCSGHGTCSALTGKCTCEGTWSGVGCHLRVLPCPHNCTDSQGRCDYTRGKCVCEPTWRGMACATPQIACPLNCSGHGTCAPDSGRCDCELTWHGIACNKRVSTCPADCVDSAHGECDEDTGQCVCRRAWTGIDCSRPHCGEHGTMRLDGSCECDPGWYAPVQDAVCELAPEECPCTRRCVADMSQQDTCSGHAYGCSVEGKCLCRHHWAGGKCEIPLIRTGEINQRNHPDAITQSRFPDRGMLLCRAAFAIYAMCRDPEALQGMVNRDDIMCVLHLNGVPVDSPAEQEKMVRVALLSHDKNGDGLLAFNEFITACAATSDPLVNRAVKWAFTDIDLEHDGVITEDEVVRKLKIRDERKRPNVMLPQPIRSVPADQDSGGLADMGRSYAEARRESAQSGAASSAGGSGSGSGPGGSANTAQSGKNATAGGHGSAAASAGPGEEAARDSLERMKREVHVPQEDQSGAWPHEGATTPPKRAGGLHQLQEGELRYRVGEAGMREEGVGSGSGLWGGKASPQGDATKDDRESASDGVGEGQSSPRHEQGGRPHARQGGTAEGHDGKHPQSSDTSNAGGAGAGGTSSGQGQESSGASSAAGGAGGESESPIRDNDYELHVDRTSKGGRQAGEGVGSPEMFARGIPPSVGEENKTEVVGDSTLSEGDATPLPEGAEMPGTGMEDREDEAEKWMDRCDKNFDAMCDEEEFPDMVAGDCPECLCLACSKGVQPSSDDKDGVKWCAVFPDAPGMRGPCGKGGRPPHGGGDENGGVGDPQALSDFEGDGGSDGSGSAGGSGRGDDDGGGDEDDKDKGGDDGGGGGGGPPGSSSTSTTTSSTSSGGGPDGSGAPPGDFPTQPGEPSPTNIPIPNPYSWCDMDNPFGNPFCPTPNPQFNILVRAAAAVAGAPIAMCVDNRPRGCCACGWAVLRADQDDDSRHYSPRD